MKKAMTAVPTPTPNRQQIEADLDECDFDLYTSIHTAPDDYADLVLELSRTAIAPLLNGATISGAEAYRAWFPEDPPNSGAV